MVCLVLCKKENQRKIFSQNLTMNKVWISGQLVCGAYFVLFQEKRKIVHIHISVHANFYLNWLSVTLIITFLRFKINFLYCSTLSSSNFTTWGELLALKPRTVNNLLNLLSEWDLFLLPSTVAHWLFQALFFCSKHGMPYIFWKLYVSAI